MTITTVVKPIDNLAALVEAFDQAEAEAKKWAEAATVLKKRIQAEMGDTTEATVGGKLTFTWRHTGQFAEKRFAADHPDLVTKYTRTVTRDEFDVEALKAEHIDLFTAYRARRFERKA